MYELMMSLELAMTALSNLASTVVEKKTLKPRTKWIAELEINLMSKIFAGPGKGEGCETVQDQQGELCKECASLIATKLLELAKLGNTFTSCMQLKRESPLMALVSEYLDKPASFSDSEKTNKNMKLSGDGAARPKSDQDGWRRGANVSS